MELRRKALAEFLRTRRASMSPRALGIVPGPRRRTPGLRREELAQRAGVSVDWYVRLEQGRDVRPSPETLDAIAGALRLDDDERGHLFFLARDEGPPRRAARDEATDEALAQALRVLGAGTPAFVLGRRFDVLAWNDAACRLFAIDLGAVPPGERNILWLQFGDGRLRTRYVDWAAVRAQSVAAFRSAWAPHADDPDFQALVGALLAASDEFRALWDRHDVRAKTGGRKVFQTEVGQVDLAYHALAGSARPEQRLVFFVAEPGSGDAVRLAQLLDGERGA